jgi:hypothetical protein
MSIEQFLENITLEELEELKRLKETKSKHVPTYSFSKIRFRDLKKLVYLKRKLNNENIFYNWFNFDYNLQDEEILFLETLLKKELPYLHIYKEENLKVKFITPILNKINFVIDDEIRDFYNEKITYESDKFIFSGETDFVFAKGIEELEKPYFFIQEFKKSKENSDPEPQLLAELISAVELNNWESIKGTYIVGAIWNFVILEKLEKHKYQYYVSQNFDSTKLEDLKDIYKNLLFIKNEILNMVKMENHQ